MKPREHDPSANSMAAAESDRAAALSHSPEGHDGFRWVSGAAVSGQRYAACASPDGVVRMFRLVSRGWLPCEAAEDGTVWTIRSRPMQAGPEAARTGVLRELG